MTSSIRRALASRSLVWAAVTRPSLGGHRPAFENLFRMQKQCRPRPPPFPPPPSDSKGPSLPYGRGPVALTVLGAGQQHRKDVLRVPRQQLPLPPLQPGRVAHVVPPARFSRSRPSAAVAWACSRAASAASRFSPSG